MTSRRKRTETNAPGSSDPAASPVASAAVGASQSSSSGAQSARSLPSSPCVGALGDVSGAVAEHSQFSASPAVSPFRGESDRAFEAFRAYLELGPRRRYAAVSRKVGASQRTIRRWASDFDWCGRIKTHTAQCAEQFVASEHAVHREECLDAAARARAFRERQYQVAEALLSAAGNYLTRMEVGDLDLLSFADACKALDVASRIGQQVATPTADDPSAPTRGLRDQLATLLDQAYGEASAPNGADAQPHSVSS